MEDDLKILERAQKRYKALRECPYEKEYRKKARENFKHFTGEDQGWDKDGARARLEAENRPALTLNKVAPIIRLMLGARPDTEARYTPVEDGDLNTAEVFNACKDHLEDQNLWEFLQEEWFLNGVVKSGSVLSILPNYDKDVRGEVELKVHDRFKFYFDDESRDKHRRDGEDLVIEENITPAKAKRTFPGKAAQIDQLVATIAQGDDEGTVSHARDQVDEYRDSSTEYYDKGTNTLRIVYYWYKDHERRTKIIDLMSGEVWDSDKDEAKLREEIGMINPDVLDRFRFREIDQVTVRYIVFSDDVILEEGTTPWEREDGQPTVLSTNLPYICFEPERMFAGAQQELISLIDPLQDPQRFHNKLASAVIEIIGTAANAGVDYEEGALTPEQKAKFKESGSKIGHMQEWSKGAISQGLVKHRQPSLPPQGHMIAAQNMGAELLDISGVESLVSTEALGKGASGKAIDMKMRQGGNIISWIYKSFKFFQFILAEYERDAIQTMYDYEKVIRIKGVKGKTMVINEATYDEMGGIAQILNDVTTGKYDVVATERESLPTLRIERLRYFSEMAKSGALQLPPQVMTKVMLHLLDDPELKEVVEDELAQFVEQAQMMAQQGAAMPQAA